MLPIHGAVYGALFAAASRVVNGEYELSEEALEAVEETRDRIEDMSDLVGDLSPTRPGTWGRFMGRVIDHSCGAKRRFECIDEARQAHGYDVKVAAPGVLVNELIAKRSSVEELYVEEGQRLETVALNGSMTLCVQRSSTAGDSPVIYCRSEVDTSKEVLMALGDLCWEGRPALILDRSRGELCLREFDLSGHHYKGDRLEFIDQWRAFYDQGIRRNILLQGPPGCGKSTLCYQAARELSERALLVSPEFFKEAGLTEWFVILELLRPQVMVLDDIDRTAAGMRSGLEEKLRFFEEGTCDIPIVLFTSNDYTRIPAAMRRPGRIDQIIRFDDPRASVRREIIEELGDREGMEIPEDQMGRLEALLQEFSAAHVVEAIRRAKVEGWKESRGEDATFRMQRDFQNSTDWLNVHGFSRLDGHVSFIIDRVKEMAETEVGFRDERGHMEVVHLPNGAQLCVEESGLSRGPSEVFYRKRLDGMEAMTKGVASLIWGDQEAILLDAVDREDIRWQELSPGRYDYYGPLKEHIERWERFREHGLRRNVLIQGPPGCGKSTFCMQAARELSTRTLMLTPDFYDMIRVRQWRLVVDLLRPEMVVIDDVDRVGNHSLETKLRLFEEGYCDIPFVLFTSNDHTKLPRPMRRPGRIDQIIEVDTPDSELRWKLIKEMAEREGVEVPEEQLPRLDRILVEKSTAYLVEALRRGAVCGWDAGLFEGDRTLELADDRDSQQLAAQ